MALSNPTPANVLIEHDERAESPEWDVFVSKCAVPYFEQTSLWGRVKSDFGWKALRVIVREDGVICGGAQILARRMRFGGAIGYIYRGPLVYPEDARRIRQIVTAVKAYALGQLSCLIIVPPYRAFPLAEELGAAGFVTHPDFLPPTGLMQGTGIIDLKPSAETIIANMNQSTRNAIRRGQRGGLTVRPGTKADLSTFWDLMAALCARRDMRPNVPNFQFLEKVWDVFSAGGLIQLRIGEVRSTPVCGSIELRTGQWVFGWRVGWSGAHPQLQPSKTIYWNAIQAAKNAGATFFDFMQADPRVADLIAAHQPVAHLPLAGLTRHKLGLGVEVWRIPSAMRLFSSAPLRQLMSLGGNTLLNSNLGKTAVKLLRHRLAEA